MYTSEARICSSSLPSMTCKVYFLSEAMIGGEDADEYFKNMGHNSGKGSAGSKAETFQGHALEDTL